jgi:hypothetical protein
MTRYLVKFVVLCAAVVGGSVALWQYEKRNSMQWQLDDANRRVAAAEERERLEKEFVARLTTHRRVAHLVVIDQEKNGGEIESTKLAFQEFGQDDKPLTPKIFTIKGNEAHVDSLVIEFDYQHVRQEDPLRGHSLVLFHRLYGKFQSPAEGFRIDDPGKPPEVYHTARTPEAFAYENELWTDFWKLAGDEKYRQQKGVRVAMGAGNWMPVQPDRIYVLTLGKAGGVEIASQPLDGIWKEYREALSKAK